MRGVTGRSKLVERRWPGCVRCSMTDTTRQVEWAERIQRQVNQQVQRVAASFLPPGK